MRANYTTTLGPIHPRDWESLRRELVRYPRQPSIYALMAEVGYSNEEVADLIEQTADALTPTSRRIWETTR